MYCVCLFWGAMLSRVKCTGEAHHNCLFHTTPAQTCNLDVLWWLFRFFAFARPFFARSGNSLTIFLLSSCAVVTPATTNTLVSVPTPNILPTIIIIATRARVRFVFADPSWPPSPCPLHLSAERIFVQCSALRANRSSHTQTHTHAPEYVIWLSYITVSVSCVRPSFFCAVLTVVLSSSRAMQVTPATTNSFVWQC